MLAMYAWYMLRNMSRYAYVPSPPTPSTVNVPQGPDVIEEPMNLEGLVTWTLNLNRVIQRLERSQRHGNRGNTTRYNQTKIWIQGCISHLLSASAEDPSKMWSSLTGDSELCESDDSPSRGFGVLVPAKTSRSGLLRHGLIAAFWWNWIWDFEGFCKHVEEVHNCPHLFKLQQLHQATMNFSMTLHHQSLFTFSELREVSDLDEWAVMHYGEEAPDDEGIQEF